ncbi:NAD(P)/FAD-dependent oxidoreductase [Prosthecomicrobium sp. N25]|uniref:NAD(P)/FAD-dependent oxidoreductase n=1 Tax=Prosthecomicrobium sp. N25 TaxID=3129254 RepID=UPI00307767AA
MDDARGEVWVIGGGPAGLMAAETAARAGAAVTVVERMPSPARKFLLAGRGGLNLTHSEEAERFLARYGDAAPQLRAAVEAFPPERLRAWAADLGEETFVGSSGRVFPKSFKASPLLRAWLRRLDGLGVRLRARTLWTGFAGTDGLRLQGPDGSEAVVTPGATVLALGGASWARLGSDGRWVPALEAAGAPVTPLSASNCGFEIAWSDHVRDRFEGEPLKRVALACGDLAVRGEAVITREGLEGGAVYALSAPLRDGLVAGPVRVLVDLRPDRSEADLAAALARTRPRDSLSNRLRKGAQLSPAAVALLREGHGRDLPSDPAALAALIKAVPLTVTGMRPVERAISTAGGLAFAGLDDRLMLRARPGVFAAGEMLDWDAPTGGYLLQASMATGFVAGRAAAEWAMRHAGHATP